MDKMDLTAWGGASSFSSFTNDGGGIGVMTAPVHGRAGAIVEPRPRRAARAAPSRRDARPAKRPLAPPTDSPRAPAVPVPALPKPSDRMATLDAARLLASAAVIWVHSVPVDSQAGIYGTFSTPFFTMVAVYFLLRTLQKSPEKSFASYAWSRLGRLYLPFLAWSIIYLVARNIWRLAAGEPVMLAPNPGDFLAGTSMQLWYLPFILLTGLAVFPIGKFLARRPHGGWGVAFACIISGIVWALAPRPEFAGMTPLDHFLSRSWDHAPSVALGVAFFILLSRLRKNLDTPPIVAVAGVAVVVLCLGSFAVMGYSTLAKTLSGAGLMLLVMCPLNWSWIRRAGSFGTYSIGVYFIHPLLTVPAREIFARCLPQHPSLLLLGSAGIVAFAYAASLAATMVLHRSSRTRWLVS